jgi:anaerobic carbon-monoxide dehydrogenase iron sulfur subunit
MEKIILVDHKKCTGCRLCENVCSVQNEGVCNPQLARMKIVKYEWEGLQIPAICQQCEQPACMAVCPVKAISRDTELGCIRIHQEKCIGCKLCLAYCPFGAITYNFVRKIVNKCEYCDGDPMCVKFCETKAIQFVEASGADMKKKRGLGALILKALAGRE